MTGPHANIVSRSSALAAFVLRSTDRLVARSGADRRRRCTPTRWRKEQAVRTALAADHAAADRCSRPSAPSSPTTKRSSGAIPTSGYSDDALWQAGQLSLDAFEKFGEAQDRDRGRCACCALLASEYPTSKFAKQVPGRRVRRPRRRLPTERSPRPRRSAPVTASGDRGDAAPRDRDASRGIRRDGVCPDVVRVTIELDGEVRVPRRAARRIPPACSSTLAGARWRRRWSIRRCASTATAELVRQIRIGRHPNRHDARRARSGRRSPATASIRSTARIAWSSTASRRRSPAAPSPSRSRRRRRRPSAPAVAARGDEPAAAPRAWLGRPLLEARRAEPCRRRHARPACPLARRRRAGVATVPPSRPSPA